MVRTTYQNIKVICILQHSINTGIDWLRRSRDHPKAHIFTISRQCEERARVDANRSWALRLSLVSWIWVDGSVIAADDSQGSVVRAGSELIAECRIQSSPCTWRV